MRRRSPRGGPAVGAGHVGLGPGLVDEHQAGRGRGRAGCRARPVAGSTRPDGLAPPHGRSFFSRVMPWRTRKPSCIEAVAEGEVSVPESRAQLLNRPCPASPQEDPGSRRDAPRSGPSVIGPRQAPSGGRLPVRVPAHANGSRSPRLPRNAHQLLYGSYPLKPLIEPDCEDQGKGLSTSMPAICQPGRHLESQIPRPVNPPTIQSGQIMTLEEDSPVSRPTDAESAAISRCEHLGGLHH